MKTKKQIEIHKELVAGTGHAGKQIEYYTTRQN